MLSEEWRIFLYPLGLIASVLFGARFFLQWIQSEIKKQSVVSRSFWVISLFGNTILNLHALIQGQYHIVFLQTTNGVVSWRNLNLYQSEEKRWKQRGVLLLFLCLHIVTFTLFFTLNNPLLEGWFRVPSAPWSKGPAPQVSLLWHAIGFFGYALFAGRFWVQWWAAEKQEKSVVGPLFWWISMTGGILSFLYFLSIRDLVNLLGPGLGLIPYFRNLLFIYKKSPLSS